MSMTRTASRPAAWVTVGLPLALGLLALGGLFHAEIAAAVQVWTDSTAYGHCFLVLPIASYMAWDRRAAWTAIPIRPWPGVALAALPLAIIWLAAERLGLMEGRQLIAMACVELLFLAVLGWRKFRALAAPLLYLFFLVPFGAFVTPALQLFTARFILVGLNVLGIPNISDDFLIEIPEGSFYVAEACAGLRFLIASVAFGVLFACLNYRSPGRRLAFIAASIVVPVLANGVRALGIVVLGHILGSAEAATVDHVLYGWIFFSIVILLLLLAGLPWRDRGPATPGTAVQAGSGPLSLLSALPLAPLAAAAFVVALAATGPAIAAMFTRDTGPVAFANPPIFAGNCTQTPFSKGPADLYDFVARVQCGAVPLTVTVALLPARASPTMLQAAERRLSGEAGAGEVERSPIDIPSGDRLRWQLVQTSEPAGLTALAVWIDGAPATQGLAGRLKDAWVSIAGSDHASAVVAVAAGPIEAGSPLAWPQIREAIVAFLKSQPDLTGEMARATRQQQPASY